MRRRRTERSSSENEAPPEASPLKGERIAKVLARAGVCSRQDAERLIAEGRVAVDGAVLTSPALNVTKRNTVTVDGMPIETAEETRLWRYHKPPGTITAVRDSQGRPTVFDRLPPDMPRVISVGRLDFNTEGFCRSRTMVNWPGTWSCRRTPGRDAIRQE